MTERIPVIIGVGQTVARNVTLEALPSPLSLAVDACQAALNDSATANVVAAIDTLAFVRIMSDSIPGRSGPFGVYGNLPRLVAQKIGAKPKQAIYSVVGGQSPQQLVNEMANRITQGDCEVVLLTGSEAIGAMKFAQRQGAAVAWDDTCEGQLEDRGTGPELITPQEIAGGMGNPPQVYGAFEHAWRGARGMSIEQMHEHMAALFAPFSAIAANNPYAQFPDAKSPAFLKTPSAANYPVAEPYLKWHVAQDAVNQGAALLLTSDVHARELGVPEEKWVYLHGGADCMDKRVSLRPELHRSAAMAAATETSLAQAGVGIDEVTHLDLYSCFPCAVQFACDGLGIDSSSRQLTQTGGLPFFGGAGNNYSMHGIASMVEQLRAEVGSHGLVLANGGFLSKEAVGIYSTTRPKSWRPIDSTDAQRRIDDVADVVQAEAPTRGIVEAYSVVYVKGEPLFAYVFAREGDKRFLARTESRDTQSVERLLSGDPLGEEIGAEVTPKRIRLVV